MSRNRSKSWWLVGLAGLLMACGESDQKQSSHTGGIANGGVAVQAGVSDLGGSSLPSGRGGAITNGGSGQGYGGTTIRGGTSSTSGGFANGGHSLGSGPALGGTSASQGGLGSSTGGASGVLAAGGALAQGGTAPRGGTSSGGGTAPSNGGTLMESGGSPSDGGTVEEKGGAAASEGGMGGSGGIPSSGGNAPEAGAPEVGGFGGSGATGGESNLGGAIELPPGLSRLLPPPGATGICNDPSLQLTFNSSPSLGSRGTIAVHDRESDAVVASVDLSRDQVTESIGSTSFNLPRPAQIVEKTVVIHLPAGGLDTGKTYYVTIDSGALSSEDGPFVIDDSETWTFTTRDELPQSASTLGINPDGSGDYCTIQGALDSIPANNDSSVTLAIAKGYYFEVINFQRKNNLTLSGEDREETILFGTNNNNLNGSTRGRALFGAENLSGLVIENMTIRNLTPQGGSQAEALRIQSCDKCVLRNANVHSLQDTLLWSGRIYAENCLITGNVDFIWGTGAAYFNACEIRTVGRSGYVVQSRNDQNGYGYVFVDSKITADPGVTGIKLARIDVSVYPGSHVAYIDCEMGSHIDPGGWVITGGNPSSSLRFWEYNSHGSSGAAIDTSGRIDGSTRISESQATEMRDPSKVLSGWEPPSEI